RAGRRGQPANARNAPWGRQASLFTVRDGQWTPPASRPRQAPSSGGTPRPVAPGVRPAQGAAGRRQPGCRRRRYGRGRPDLFASFASVRRRAAAGSSDPAAAVPPAVAGAILVVRRRAGRRARALGGQPCLARFLEDSGPGALVGRREILFLGRRARRRREGGRPAAGLAPPAVLGSKGLL